MTLIDYMKPKIIFMGTPDFAVACLERLIDGGCNIIAVVTSPDKPAGRGLANTLSAVKKFAIVKGLLILQPEKLKGEEFLKGLKKLQADLQIVVAFRMLPEVVWSMPPLGTINLHASLLPQYRGAAPINWAIINGETFTGVTTFKLKHDIDTGDIYLSQKIDIDDNETAGELHDRMKTVGSDLLLKTVDGLEKGILKEHPQMILAGYNIIRNAPKIFTETCRIDWNKPVLEIFNLIRGLSPSPGAFTQLKGKKMKIFKCKNEVLAHSISPGAFFTDNKTFLKVSALNGYIYILEVQLEGKKKLSIEQFLNGFKVEI